MSDQTEPTGERGPIRIYVVEDDTRQLRAMRKLLEGDPGVLMVGAASSGEQALREIAAATPDLVLMDLELPGASGIETTRALRLRSAEPEILVLTSYDDEDHVFEAMRAGAGGYVVKGASAEKLLAAIREIDAGGTVIEPRLARRFWAYFKGVQEPKKAAPEMTHMEREVLFAIAKGLSNAEVGRVVGLDRRTVRTHLGHIYSKLGVRSHVDAVIAALKLGLVEL
jgi:DNA-binding NarL/FixJ family response regulator